MPNIRSSSPFTSGIMGLSDLSDGELQLSTYATILLVLVILKELPELSNLIKASPNDRIMELITKILGFAAEHMKTLWKAQDNEENLKKQKEKIDSLLKELDLFADVPAEISSASEELSSQIETSEKFKNLLIEKMQTVGGLLTKYRTDLATLRNQHVEALIEKIEQRTPLSQTEKETLRHPKQTQRETLIETLQALSSQLEKALTKESLHELSEKQQIDLVKKTLKRDNLSMIELEVINALINNFAKTNVRTPKINELRAMLKELDSTFDQQQETEKRLNKKYVEDIGGMGINLQKTAKEMPSLNGLSTERLAALEKQIITPTTTAEELV